MLLQFFATFSNKVLLLLNIFLSICNNFSEQSCLDKPVFNNVSRLNHSSPVNNSVTSKINHFPQLFALKITLIARKITLLSFLISHYHQTRYMRL